ncbi:MAG: HAMP domain-containing sensor histidine kinase [Bdellovibrionota bacterium]
MRLVLKFSSALLAGILLVFGIYGYLRISRIRAIFEEDTRSDHRAMASALANTVGYVWQEDGETRALKLIEAANEREPRLVIRWVWLDEALSSDEKSIPPRKGFLDHRQNEWQWVGTLADGERHLYTYRQIEAQTGRPGVLELSESFQNQEEYISSSIRRMFQTGAFFVGVCGIISVLMGYSFVARPMQGLVAKARRVGTGDFSGPLDFPQQDEIGQLAREMNAMSTQLDQAHRRIAKEEAGRIAALEQLRHADRLATVGTFVSGVAHDLGTPLNVILGRANLIESSGLSAEESQKSAHVISEQTRRMIRSIQNLLGFSRMRLQEKGLHDLAAVAREVVALLVPLAENEGIILEMEPVGHPLPARIDPNEIGQALANLIVNAIQASREGARVLVRLNRTSAAPPGNGASPQECFSLSVVDQGAGISPEHEGRIFEPFFTTKGEGEGTGLGLSVARGIVEDHAGWIGFRTEQGKGSEFTIYLPEGVSV